MKIKNISVFFPLFNEEGNVETIVKRAVDVLEKLNLEYEIILVNDGSTDNTSEVINKIVKTNNRIKTIYHPKNLGYGEALKSGFYGAKYDVIVYTDGDNQFNFSEISKFLEKIDEYDLIVGYRIKRQDLFFRILFKMGWTLSLLAFFRLTLKDVDCGFKMIKRKVLEKIPHLQFQRGAMINAELVIKTKKAGFKIGQVGVNHYPRLSGKPTGASLNVIIKSYLDLLKLWWQLKKDKKIFFGLLFVLSLALFFRVYQIDQYMIFLGDEGRDALIVRDLVRGSHFTLIGPPTSVGNIYLGPLYYYMMALPFFLFNSDPVWASVMVAFLGVLIVGLIYYLGKIWFGKVAGLISAFLYAISPVTINYSNFSWNPNPTPLFALLTIFSIYKMHKSHNFLYLILTGVFIAGALQMHYLSLILIPVAITLWIYEIWYSKFKNILLKNVVKGTILGIIVFFLVMSPLLFFDLRHNFLNFNSVTTLLEKGNTINTNIIENILRIPSLYSYNLIGRYMVDQNFILELIVSILILIPIFYFHYWPLMALGIWLILGLLGLSFYPMSIYDHYLGFLNPAPYLLLGSLASIKLRGKKSVFNFGLLVLIIVLTFVNLSKNPQLSPPNKQLERTQNVARFIIEKTNGEDFNFALIAENNYDSAYQYYLEEYGQKPKLVPAEKTEQLFVVCEDFVCDPTHNAKYEVAGFGMSKIEWMEEKFGVRIYKLISNPSGKPQEEL